MRKSERSIALSGEAQTSGIVAGFGKDLARHADRDARVVRLVPALADRNAANVRAERLRQRELGVDGQGFVGQLAHVGKAIARHAVEPWQGAQIQVIGRDRARGLGPRLPDFFQADGRLDRADHAFGDLVLQLEDVADVALEAVGPDVASGDAIDQLPDDAQSSARLPDAAFEHVADAELA